MTKKKPLKKRILNSTAAHFLVSLLLSGIIRFIYMTCRKEYHFPEATKPYINGEFPAVFCFWHGRMIMQLLRKPPGRPMFVLSSHHNDGALIVAAMRRFGIESVRGSQKLGGAQALRSLLKITDAGGNVSITPDGPRGPFQVAAQGAAFVAAKTHYPLVGVTFSAIRYWRFSSWDKFMLPKPFTRICYVATELLYASSDDHDAIFASTQQLQENLTAITAEADRLCGVPI